ncbi:MAG TPA: NAD(P)H-dependent glycerol-3-phosphate dehydrogenase [Terriglobales bacterium]|nr:NAD(P)H-dependent glycerol-3-phosphate dehydrogenase [Terriglobales bacterium]
MSRIAVIGAGSWGTALAVVLSRNGRHQVRLWAFEKAVAEAIRTQRVNQIFLPGFPLPEAVAVVTRMEQALDGAEIVVTAVPSQHCRSVYEQMPGSLNPKMLFVSATKGLESGTSHRMTEVATDVIQYSPAGFPPRMGALSGPSFAREAARGDPTAITIASTDKELGATVQSEFSDPNFRVYTNEDVVGVELGGALKNIIAIAAGVCVGLGLGHNTIAALMTRGLSEITRLAVACGGHHETLAGLAGMGDLVLTCTGGLSRNRTLGVELGKGRKLPDVLAEMHGMVAEGVLTTNAARELASRKNVEMPITAQMHAILNQGKPPQEAIRELMTRPATGE